MTNFYVRKSGSDANAGTSAALAWATIGKALTGGMASGDTVYIGAGVYREAVTITITPTATTSIIADVDGSHTGDAGEVRWTAYTTDDKTAPGTFASKLNGKNLLSFSNIHFVGGSNAGNGSCIDGATVASSHDLTFAKCAFTNGSSLSGAAMVNLTGRVDNTSNYIFDSCIFGPGGGVGGHVLINLPTSTTADYDAASIFSNCIFIPSAGGCGVGVQGTGANSFKGGGVTVRNCFPLNGRVFTNSLTSVAYPVLTYNCVFDGKSTTACFSATSIGQIVEDYNLIWDSVPRSNVSIGPFSQATGNYSQLFSYGQEFIWGGQLRPFGVPLSGSPMLGFGNAILVAGRAPTMTDDATVGTIAWTNPSNAATPSDSANAVATAIPATTGVSHYLKATGYAGLSGIPSDATIKSIRVETLISASATASVSCNSIKLVKAGVISGNDLASSNTTQFPTVAGLQSWGNTTDPLWGLALTPSDVQATNFGVVFSAKNTSGTGTRDCSVDFIRVIVAYTTADGAGGVATDVLGASRPAGGGSTSYAVGALERGNTATVQSTTVHTPGGSAWQLSGPAYQDAYANVDAISVTVSVWARYDTAGQQPTVTIKAAPELGLNADTALTWSDPGANTWGQFTTTITPTAAGVIQLRLATANGTGAAYFDDVTLS